MRISKRLVLGIAIPILILGLGLILVFAIFKTARVYIMVAPESATITINGIKYKNGVHNLFPGKKTVRVSGENIEDYETEFEIGLFQTKRVAVYRPYLKKKAGVCTVPDVVGVDSLKYCSDESYDEYIKSRSDYLVLKMLSSERDDPKAVEFLQKIEKARKIFNDLPTEFNNTITTGEGANTRWTIERAYLSDYSQNPNCPAAICILLKAPNPKKVKIDDMIRDRGYNPDDYYIVEKKIND